MGAAGSIQSPRNGANYMQVEDEFKKQGREIILAPIKLVKHDLKHPQVKLDRLLILNHDPRHITYIGPSRLTHDLPPSNETRTSNNPLSLSKIKANQLKDKMTNRWDDMENESRTRLPHMRMSRVVKM